MLRPSPVSGSAPPPLGSARSRQRIYADTRVLQFDDVIPPAFVQQAWARDRKGELGGEGIVLNKTGGMETRLADVPFKLHVPYLYCHQGNCEHVMVFTDVRLMRTECESAPMFPFITLEAKRNQAKCQICEIFYAEFVTQSTSLNDFRVPYNPCRFCKNCFTPLHYEGPDAKTLKYNFQFGKFTQDY